MGALDIDCTMHDNAVSCPVYTKLKRYGREILKQLAYSPDLAPSDFHLLWSMKKLLGIKKFDYDDDLKEFYDARIFKLILCRVKCLNMKGSYVEK